MELAQKYFGTSEKGESAELFILSNDNGVQVKITNYGGIITDIIVPDKNGRFENVVLGFDTIEEYYSDACKSSMPYFGAIVGRYANRINKGKFEIDDMVFNIPCNLGNSSLHGGIEGFDKKIWKAETYKNKNEVGLKLTYTSKNLEEGFPGNLKVKVTHSLNNKNELKINYEATTDKKTHLNLTDHSYFNLSGFREDVLNHEVIINADTYTEVDDNAIPTGKLSDVTANCMDFRKPHKIGRRIDEVQGNGYDHNYVINGYDGKLRKAAEAFDHVSGRRLEVMTTEPGLQFYAANHLDGSLNRGGVVFSKRMGFCFETQHFPDSPNQAGFPSTLLIPGKEFHSTTVYRFSILEE